jgi:hypothetical protein
LHCLDNSLTQVTRQRFRHRRSPHRRINADRLAQPNRLGNPPDSNPAEFALALSIVVPSGFVHPRFLSLRTFVFYSRRSKTRKSATVTQVVPTPLPTARTGVDVAAANRSVDGIAAGAAGGADRSIAYQNDPPTSP